MNKTRDEQRRFLLALALVPPFSLGRAHVVPPRGVYARAGNVVWVRFG